MTKVSVIIPVYNQGRFLREAIQSCLEQSYEDVEIIVVNDGSTDETPQIVQGFQDYPNVKIIHQENTGLPGARNRGIRESSGDYLCFLDSDDYYDSEKIKLQAEILDGDESIDFIYCDIITVDESGVPVDDEYSVGKARAELSGDIFPSLLLGGYFPPHTVMLRRSCLEQVGEFDPELGGHADYDLWLRLAASGCRACYLDRKLAYYRTHPASMSKDWNHMNETRLAALVKVTKRWPEIVAQNINKLITTNEELYKSNQWLNNNWQGVLDQMAEVQRTNDELYKNYQWLDQQFTMLVENNRKNEIRQQLNSVDAHKKDKTFLYSLIEHFEQSVLLEGAEDQKGIWDVTLDGISSRTIFLHPPAKLCFHLPIAEQGKLIFAISLHPDVWENPESGGCIFGLTIDDRTVLHTLIDPVQFPSERMWHPFIIPVPANLSTGHKIEFSTTAYGESTGYRWALWKDPVFVSYGG
ncbi:MAG: glycosyltransferase [Anaerolineales bacterium]